MKYVLNIVLGFLAIVFFIYGTMQSIEATKQQELAAQMSREALLAEQDAIRQRDMAEANRKRAEEVTLEAKRAQEQAEAALRECQKKKR